VKDLSSLAADSMWVTSQAAGNMMSGRPGAMSAPGSPPVDPLPPAAKQDDPHVTPSAGPKIEPGHHGIPQPRAGPPAPGHPAWAKTGTAGQSHPGR
jgi:hypothetical protein